MDYNSLTSVSGATDIYFNHELHYPHGALVTINGVPVTSSDAVVEQMSVSCSVTGTPIVARASVTEAESSAVSRQYTNHVLITPTDAAPATTALSVTITRCGLTGQCTCRR